MDSTVAKTLQIIKDRFDSKIDVHDPVRYNFGFLFPKPTNDNERELAQWEKMRDNHKWPVEITERWNETLSAYKRIHETDSIAEVIKLLKSLQFYLEIEASRPRTTSTLGKRENGEIFCIQLTRPPKFDQFFEDRVLSKLRPSIAELEHLIELTRTIPNSEIPTIVIDDKTGKSKETGELPPPTPVYDSFEELFKNNQDINVCVDALRNVTPSLINEKREWVGRKNHSPKAVFCAWIRRLEDTDKIIFVADKKILVPLINNYFPGINFGADARTFKDDLIRVDYFNATILP